MENRFGGSESFTVQHALNMLDDHIETIEDINTNGDLSRFVPIPNTQEATNKVMQQYIDGIKAILAWNGLDGDGNALTFLQPDVAGYSGDKSTYTTAIALGDTYITENT